MFWLFFYSFHQFKIFFLTHTKKNNHTDIPAKSEYQDEVSPFIGNLTTDTMKEVLTEFTNFRNRYYKSSYGAQSCRWLIQQIRDVAEGFDHVSVKEFEHSVSIICARICICVTNKKKWLTKGMNCYSGINSLSLLDLKDQTRIWIMNWLLLVLIKILSTCGYLVLVVHPVLM